MNELYKLELDLASGGKLPMSHLKDKVILVVNIASQCGYAPQLAQLQQLKEQFKDSDFEIVAVPSNEFGRQEPLDDAGIQQFCDIRFKATFPVAAKSEVKKGSRQHPLFNYLSDKKKNQFTHFAPVWNFHKYLIDKKGRLRAWYFPFTQPLSKRITSEIKSLLSEN